MQADIAPQAEKLFQPGMSRIDGRPPVRETQYLCAHPQCSGRVTAGAPAGQVRLYAADHIGTGAQRVGEGVETTLPPLLMQSLKRLAEVLGGTTTRPL